MNLKVNGEISFAEHCEIFLQRNVDLLNGTLYIGSKAEIKAADGVSSEVNSDLAAEVMKNLILLTQIGHKELSVVLNCPGGDVQQALAIYDALIAFDGKVSITVVGEAYSMGAIILQAGDERLLSPNSSVMIHDGTRSYSNVRVKDYRKMSRHDDANDKKCYDILLHAMKKTNPNMTLAKLKKIMSSDEYFTAEDAVAIGLADRIDR